MRNLKKTLAVVLAFAMIFSMGIINTFAYSDVEAGTMVDEAVGILSNLNIITGFEDGTFRPEETVTRAQMAAIICRTLGYESQAESSKGATVFNDVAADHWASGYINVAQAQQIINGYGDGNFGPEDKVTYEQAVKMIVSALGYDLVAASKGGYPTGYLAVASAEGISKGSNGRVGDAAKRSTIAILVYNSLEVQLMDQTSWSTGTEGNKYQKDTKTILSHYLDVEKWEGVVTTTPLTNATNGWDVNEKPALSLSNASKWGFVGDDYKLTADTFPATVNASLVDDVNQFYGKKVIAYIGEEADPSTNDQMLYAIAEKQGANTVTTINAKNLIATDATENEIAYRNDGSTKKITIDLYTGVTGAVNYTAKNNTALKGAVADSPSNILNTKDIAKLAENGGVIELIENNSANAGIDFINIIAYNAEAVVKEVEADDNDIKFDTYNSSLKKIDKDAEDKLVIVYKDGVVAAAEDIAANDTISVAKITSNDDVRVFYVSSKAVTGVVSGYGSDYVTIDGEDYKLSTKLGKTPAELSKYEGTFFLNVDGQIAYADASAAKGNYGLVLSVGKTGTLGANYIVNVVLADGSVVEYDLADKNIDYNGTAKTGAEVATALSTIMQATSATTSYTANEAYTHTDKAADLVFEVKLNKDGEVKGLTALNPQTASGTKYSEEKMTYGGSSFSEETVVFGLAGASGSNAKVEDSDVKVGKIGDFFVDGDAYTFKVFDYEDKVYGGILGYNLVSSISPESDAVIVTEVKSVSYDEEIATQISGIQAGEEVTYIIYNEKGYASDSVDKPEEITAGDVIFVGAANEEGVVGDFQMLYKRTASTNYAAGVRAADIGAKKIYYYASYVDVEKAINDDFIWVADYNANVTQQDNNRNFILMQNAANYTVVDYTEDATYPEFSDASADKGIFGDLDENDVFVFVRTYDEELTEVVVYRTAINRANITVADATAGGFSVTSSDSATLSYSVNGGAFGPSAGTVAEGDVVIVKAVKAGKATNMIKVVVEA